MINNLNKKKDNLIRSIGYMKKYKFTVWHNHDNIDTDEFQYFTYIIKENKLQF